MTPAIMSLTQINIDAGRFRFRASGTKPVFKGFLIVYNPEVKKTQEEEEDETRKIPHLIVGDALDLLKLTPNQHFTKPPPRYSDASLVRDLEEKGIGRPSTYAPIIYTIIMRNYVKRDKGYLSPTELGIIVIDLLVEHFPKIMDVTFTSTIEDKLDEVESGKMKWVKVLRDFYAPFASDLEIAKTAMESIKKKVIKTDEICEECGKPMVVKWGRRGKFLSCGEFPKCRHSRSITTGVKCPNEGCAGELVERRAKKGGRLFYGCTKYPNCTYIGNKLPEQEVNKEEVKEEKKAE